MDTARPTASTNGVWNGLIVGLDEQVEGLAAKRVLNAAGMTVLHGFHDAHNHMPTFGHSLLNIDANACDSLDELYAAVRGRTLRGPYLEWIIVDSYDQSKLGGHPTRTGLDGAAAGRKVIVNHRTTHMLVASSSVFEQVGAMSSDWPVPDGGFVERDETGSPAASSANRRWRRSEISPVCTA